MKSECVRTCPKCKSNNIKRDMSVSALIRDIAQNDFICNKCGYRGQFFPEKLKQDSFGAKKRDALQKLASATKAGLVDEEVLPLLDKINSLDAYYTTSSCAGRISLTRATEGKAESVWFFKSHSVVKVNELWNALQRATEKCSGVIEFKMEPVILHAGCRDLASAAKLVKLARLAGWSESGIFETEKRFIVELRSTENMLCPIANKNKILVSKEHAALIIKEANKRLKNTQKKLARLLEMLNNF